ncbi:hypothetical protein AB4Z09_06765 [Rhodococcus sp. TAF43]|uniref:hypothetical protein n=1 Tax=unclassified Rhodococcus (in: high G+C Gram-positive bacteria) TaxID=192944 RepID=UPI000E0AC334|nr:MULTISPECIES: hypothetical protein [unclassified Rhodococcus (in: high G+C Gram-positive bacteria)]QKT12623.1 hypothetical protein HUN07_19680 [Rhodococcus sp. W8901]RDI25663.1 hypothetical protein DEU38_1097 [Rhodococcus sp. AG1013]
MTLEPPSPPAPEVATAVNRARTVAVRATEAGLPLDIRIDERELRYGGERLADEILRLCREAAREAGSRRREQLAHDGMPEDVLDRLGLPTREQVAVAQQAEDENQAPTSWMRRV